MRQYRIHVDETDLNESYMYVGGCGCCADYKGFDTDIGRVITKQDLLDAEEYFNAQLKSLIPLKKYLSNLEDGNIK